VKEGSLAARCGAQRAAVDPLHPLLDSSLMHATDPPLSNGAAAPVRVGPEWLTSRSWSLSRP
jgi:hypothetical protein